jgi:glycine cleavage system H protein
VNAEALQNPSLVRNDPYGKGWLIKVHVPDEESTMRNLLPTGMVRRWMSEVAEQFYGLQPQLAGAVSADGGLTVEDPLAELPHISWKETASEFFLTGSGSEIARS